MPFLMPVQSVSPAQLLGVLLQGPQPRVTGGTSHSVPASPPQSLWAWQQSGVGQPNAGQLAGVSLTARQPTKLGVQLQPRQVSATQAWVARHCASDLIVEHGGASPASLRWTPESESQSPASPPVDRPSSWHATKITERSKQAAIEGEVRMGGPELHFVRPWG